MASSSSTPAENDKPVIVRVKRKASQSRLDAFWLEINERPLKRPLLDFGNLSISDSSDKVEELKSRKFFVQHVTTLTTSEISVDILQHLVSNSADGSEARGKSETRRTFKTANKQDQLLSKAKQQQQMLSKNARFEQVWRSRKEKEEHAHDEALNQMFRLYDVVHVEEEEKRNEVNVDLNSELEDCRMMFEYLPLLREVLPSAAAEVEANIHECMSKGALPDNYVYDCYAVRDDMEIAEQNAPSPFPLVQVDDDENFYDGPDDAEHETDDSNDENNPLNDYPDEESSCTEEDDGSRCFDEKSKTERRSSSNELEDESISEKSSELEMLGDHVGSDGAHLISEGEIYDDDVDWGFYEEEEEDFDDEGEWR